MDASAVLAGLEGAFPAQPLPSVSPHQAQLADQSLSRRISEEEWVAAGRPDAGRTWKQFTDEELIECEAALSHFDEVSFVYYLPAFLGFAARHCDVEWNHPAWSLVGSIVFAVTHHKSAYGLGRYKRLSEPQRGAVVSFLEFMSRNADDQNATYAQKSLERYWNTHEATKPLIIAP